jgi:catechol 2,3-dioxygenase-like lactoylglutathione lyase family enzyme
VGVGGNTGRSEMPVRLSGVQHVGVPVRSLEHSLAFYRDAFGIEPRFIATSSGAGTSRLVGVPDAEMDFAFLDLGNTVLELLEYTNPQGQDYDRRNCDVGATHVAFEVADVEAAYQELSAKGIEFSGPPLHIEEGPLAGCVTAYFKDPDGIQLEIFQLP